MLKESIELHREGRLDEAEQGYRAALAANPGDVDALHMLGLLLHQRGETGEGERLLDRARELAPEDAAIEATLASLHFRHGDHAAAEDGYRRALALDPNIGGVHSGLGQIALIRGDKPLAEQHFRTALRAGEDDALALTGLGTLLLERGDADAALRHLVRAAELAPEDAMVQTLLGQAFVQRGTPAFAEQAFANAVRLRPELHRVRQMLAEVLLRAGRPREAEEHYRALLAAPEFRLPGLLGLADSAYADDRLDEAVANYRAALALDPLLSTPMRALAWALARLGRADEALAVYDDYLARAPDDRMARRGRADLLLLTGRLPEAAEAWRGLAGDDPADLQPHRRLATIGEALGDHAAAESEAARVLLAAPADPEMLLVRARAELRRGDDAGAAATLGQLAPQALEPAQAAACWNALGRLHDRAGDPAEAVRCFVEAQRGAASGLPELSDPRPALQAVADEPPDAPWPEAPVLLLGAPGSGVEQVAALLADQPDLLVLRDRLGAVRGDDFDAPDFDRLLGPLGEDERAAARERYLAPLRAGGVPPGRRVVDWLPRWDARLLALIRRAMPGARLLVVDGDPRDTLLNWLAFGGFPGFGCPAPDPAAQWLRRARRHLHFGRELDAPARQVVNAGALADAPDGAAARELAAFLALDGLVPGARSRAASTGPGGLPLRFPDGHWQRYADVLAEPFRHLTT